VLFCTIYAVGFSLLTCSAGLIPSWAPKNHEKPTQSQTASLFIALYIIALGTGGIKPNVSSFGADQFDVTDPVALKQKESFFNYFYRTQRDSARQLALRLTPLPVVINCGSLIASIAIVQVQNSSWKIGFLIPTIAMIVSVLCFVAGSSRYRHSPRPTGGSPITRALRIMWLGGRESWRSRRKGYVPPLAAVPVREEGGLIGAKTSAVAIPAWLQLATHEKGGRFSSDQAEEVALIVRLVPIMLTGVIFWAVYAQMSTAFVQQGGLMDCRLGSFVISQASLSSFDTISIILLIPLFDKLLYPRLRRAGFRVSNLQRTGAGYIFAVFAMLAAAAVEKGRQAALSNGNVFPAPPAPSPPFPAPPSPGRHLLQDAYPPPQIVRISVFAQIPQYMLVGTAEVLAAVAQLDWFYSEAPATMRSMGMALQLLSVALGQYLASALTILISGLTSATGCNWYPKDLNKGRLDLFFLLLAVLMLLDFFAFWFCARRFVSVSGDAEAGAGAATLDSVGGATPDQFSSPAVPPSTGGASNPFSTPGKGGEW